MNTPRIPRIKKALSRAIEHELARPGELAKFLEYLHMQKAFEAVGWGRSQ